MSIEITLHPQRATRKALKQLLEELGYRPCENLWKWPKGSLNYHWFDAAEHKSYDGVEANISTPDKSSFETLGPCTWMLHTRTRASASPADKDLQNNTVREARRRFGGRFYNDWYGINRYTVTSHDGRDAISRGIYLLYERVTSDLKAVIYSLPEGHKPPKEPQDAYGKRLLEMMGTADPVRVLYNALVPFAVASLEHFFGQTFRIFLTYDAKAREKIVQQTRKVDMADLLAVREGSKSIGDIVADWYSFQNIDSIHKAFSEWMAIDVWKILRNSRLPGSDLIMLSEALDKIIEFRHGIVHRYAIDRELDRKQISTILETSIAVIDEFTKHVEKSRGVPVRDIFEAELEGNAADLP